MDALEIAIYESLDPTATQCERIRALETLEKAKTANNSWQICLERLVGATKVEVRFWCLQTLSDIINSSTWSSFDTSLKLFLRDTLTFYYFGVHLEEWNESKESTESWKQWKSQFPETFLEADIPNFLRNKCAQLFSALVSQEYPHNWSNLFRRLFSILPDIESMKQSIRIQDIELLHRFFLVFICLDDDYISLSAIQRIGKAGLRIRDGLRSDCVPQLLNLAIQLTYLYPMTNDAKVEEVCCLSLDICRRFVEWIDISLVMDDLFISTIFSLMIQPGKRCGKSIAARIFSEIVSKKMNLEKKYQLLFSLNLVEFLNQLSRTLEEVAATNNNFIQESSTVVDYLESLGYPSFELEIVNLINTIASEGLELMSALRNRSPCSADISKIHEWIRCCLSVMTKCFQFEDDKISLDTWEFLMRYVNYCGNVSDDMSCAFILSVIWDQFLFTEEKTCSEDKFIQFQELRGRLVNLFKNICRVYPALAMNTIQSHLEQLNRKQQGWDMQTLEEMECIYSLTNAFVELIHKTKDWDVVVFRVLSVLPNWEWFSVLNDSYTPGRHWIMEQMIIAYDDLLSHCVSLFESDLSFIYNILVYLMDERGLGNPYSLKLRNKAASTVLRICRPLRQILATHFFELMLNTLESIILQTSQNVCESPMVELDHSDFIGFSEKLFLIEVVGMVLGSCWDLGFSKEECERRLENWISSLITTMESSINTQNVSLGCYIMEALTCIAKGFTVDSQDRENHKGYHRKPSETTQQEMTHWNVDRVASPSVDFLIYCWKRCFTIVFQFLKSFGSVPTTKEKCLVFLHRMVETLGEEALAFIQSSCLELIALHSSPTELSDIFLLVNQVLVRLKGNAMSFLFEIFHPLLQSFFHYFQSMNKEYLQSVMADPLHCRSEIWRENTELVKIFHLFLYHLVSQQLEEVLLHPNHRWLLLSCLGMLVDAVSISTCSDSLEFNWMECKYAWIVVRKLVQQPNADTFKLDTSDYTLRQWIVFTFVPLSIILLFRMDWKKPNKVQLGIVEEIVEFYMACKTCPWLNPDWENCFHQSLSKLSDIPPQVCQELFLICQQQDKNSIYASLIGRMSKECNFF